MKKDITGSFVFIDDFCKGVDEYLSRFLIPCTNGVKKVTRVMGMTLSELLTIELLYHESPCKNFKYFYHISPALSGRVSQSCELQSVC